MIIMLKKITLVCLFLVSLNLTAEILNIPDDYYSIEYGINHAQNGDTLLVQPGTYEENINFYGKNITLASLFLTTQDSSYIDQTIIDAEGSGTVVKFEHSENSSALLCGFTLANGHAYNATNGGGILCDASSPTIDHVKVTNCDSNRGGGIYIADGATPLISNCEVSNNSAIYRGGGICVIGAEPLIQNVIVKNNSAQQRGGGIYVKNTNINIENSIIINNSTEVHGGGIYFDNSDSNLTGVTVTGNTASKNGGGIGNDDSTLQLAGCSIYTNSALQHGGGIYSLFGNYDNINFDLDDKCSIYDNNSDKSSGKDLFFDILGGMPTINVVLDTFSVDQPTAYFASPIDNINFNIESSMQNQINSDIYVSPDGDNTNSGLNLNEPFRTIEHAISRIYVDASTSNTINLAPGIYSQQTNGEIFPINMFDYLCIVGETAEATILDGNSISSVIEYFQQQNPGILSNLTIRNGYSAKGGGLYSSASTLNLDSVIFLQNNAINEGGGVYCANSIATLNSIQFIANSAEDGGGLACGYDSDITINNSLLDENNAENGAGIYSTSSSFMLESSRVTNNSATDTAGGIYSGNFDFKIINTVVAFNEALQYAGGIYNGGSNFEMESTSVYGNYAAEYGGIWTSPNISFDEQNRNSIYLNETENSRTLGKDFFYYSGAEMENIHVVLDTFSVLNPTSFYACPTSHLTFDILNSIDELIASDLYVSQNGNNYNSGLTENEPLLTINYAISRISADSSNPRTIHLAAGIYSLETNGEIFPIDLPDFINLKGVSETETILDANESSSVINISYNDSGKLEKLTIRNGAAWSGGGVYCENSNPTIRDITVTDNKAINYGGGLYFRDSDPILTNVTVSNNSSIVDTSEVSGAGLYFYHSNPIIDSCLVINNSHGNSGGGMGVSNYVDSVHISNSIFRNNSADNGGGLSLGCPNTVIANTEVSNNNALRRGGGIYYTHDLLELNNVLIAHNQSGVEGGGIYLNSCALNAENVTIASNYSDFGGGICSFSSHMNLRNTILWNEDCFEISYLAGVHPSILTIDYCDIEFGISGIYSGNQGEVEWLDHNIELNPLFEDIYSGNFNLQPDSPCIDAGDPSTANDPDGSVADIGAFFYDHGLNNENMEIESIKNSLVNYPNPFNPTTKINFYLENPEENISLDVFNIKGQKIKTLIKGQACAGNHSYIWNGTDEGDNPVSSGVYLYKLRTKKKEEIKKMILLK